jgi:hypothetical protein
MQTDGAPAGMPAAGRVLGDRACGRPPLGMAGSEQLTSPRADAFKRLASRTTRAPRRSALAPFRHAARTRTRCRRDARTSLRVPFLTSFADNGQPRLARPDHDPQGAAAPARPAPPTPPPAHPRGGDRPGRHRRRLTSPWRACAPSGLHRSWDATGRCCSYSCLTEVDRRRAFVSLKLTPEARLSHRSWPLLPYPHHGAVGLTPAGWDLAGPGRLHPAAPGPPGRRRPAAAVGAAPNPAETLALSGAPRVSAAVVRARLAGRRAETLRMLLRSAQGPGLRARGPPPSTQEAGQEAQKQAAQDRRAA